jgi:hypothetical protein
MLENKHYGRQIILSLFVTVFLLIGVLYLSVRFLVPMYKINQEQLYDILIRMFPILIGLVMVEIGVLIARKRDEDYVDEIDKLPPNAYDKPLYTLPGDDPSHLHSDEMTFGHAIVKNEPSDLDFGIVHSGTIDPVAIEKEEVSPVSGIAPVGPIATMNTPVAIPEPELATYDTGFASILSIELQNAISMDYDLTLILIEVQNGPKVPISNKLIIQSGELAYCYLLDNGIIAMVLPFYNSDEAKNFMVTMVQECTNEFKGCSLEIGFASRNERTIDSDFLYHEAEEAILTKSDEVN